jgi:hypothetical protein
MVSDEAERDLLKLAQELGRAERTKDVVALRSLLADEYRGVGASGDLLTKGDVLQRFSNAALEFTEHEVNDLRVKVLESVGLIFGNVRLSGKIDGQSFAGQFRFMDVCVKRSGKWQIMASQLTPFSRS